MTERAREPGIPLTELREGGRGRVVWLDRTDKPATAHLIAVGILPGAELLLTQRYPAYVVELENTAFALDHALAQCIHVAAV